jgi:para-nitrobenzyl esterase
MQTHRNIRVFTGMVVVAMLCLWSSDVGTQSSSCLVSTSSGAVQGVDRGASCAFLGVPYAAPPIRWKPPQPAAPWAPATLNAVTAPPNCPGFSAATGQPQGSEDCLRVIIWTPDPIPSAPAPVIVWLHPGAFVAASANLAAANGQKFVEQTGAIVVAANYRLGPFGFLAHSALTAEDPAYPSSGNYGLLDQRAALAWVRTHISAFGGDSNSVTLAGSSSGALSAGLHLVSPGSTGLFDRAILQSGTPTFRFKTTAEAGEQGDSFAAALGCSASPDVLACLRSKTRDQVLRALPIDADQILEGRRVQWGPVVDGVEIPDQPRQLFESGVFHRVPVIVGTNRDEGWPFVDRSFSNELTSEQYTALLETEFGAESGAVAAMYQGLGSPKATLAAIVGDVEFVCEARRVARAIERTGTPVYQYSFDYEVDPIAQDRVNHGLEVNLLFGNNFGPPSNYMLNDADLTMFRRMAGYWARFAASGNPNSEDETVVHWPAFKHPTGHGRGADKYLVLESDIHERQRLHEAACDFWEPFNFRSVIGAVPAATP